MVNLQPLTTLRVLDPEAVAGFDWRCDLSHVPGIFFLCFLSAFSVSSSPHSFAPLFNCRDTNVYSQIFHLKLTELSFSRHFFLPIGGLSALLLVTAAAGLQKGVKGQVGNFLSKFQEVESSRVIQCCTGQSDLV